jgi:hypothetical protein
MDNENFDQIAPLAVIQKLSCSGTKAVGANLQQHDKVHDPVISSMATKDS